MSKLETFKLNSRKLNSRRAAAFAALAIGAVAFAGSAAAAPLELFPFIMTPPTQVAPPQVAAAPSEDEATVFELPSRLKTVSVSLPWPAGVSGVDTVRTLSTDKALDITVARTSPTRGRP